MLNIVYTFLSYEKKSCKANGKVFRYAYQHRCDDMGVSCAKLLGALFVDFFF